MELKDNGKGIISVSLTQEELFSKGFGNICDQCGNDINGNSRYIPVLNMVFCHECSEKYLKSHSLPPEDKKYQERNLLIYFPELMNLSAKL
jgi:hypothetical protein